MSWLNMIIILRPLTTNSNVIIASIARASIRPDPSRLSRTKSQAPTSAPMEPSSNMVLSSEIRSSVTQTRVAEMFKDKALESLKEAEGGSTVEAAVKLHADALMAAMAKAMASGTVD